MSRSASSRAFPVLFASDVAETARFYEDLGFQRRNEQSAAGRLTFVALERFPAELAVVDAGHPESRYGWSAGTGPRFEMFVFVDDVERTTRRLRESGTPILSDPVDMPWGERVAYAADPDGNPVGIASATPVPQHT